MSERYPGGIITKNAIVPSGPYGTNEAPGIWTLDQALQAQRAGNWPVVGGPYDLYFDYVTLLLHGDGTNGGQNNTFVDGSTNNFTITRNGNTTQGSFSPYGSLWSNYFDGNGDYLTVPDSAAFDFSTAPNTIEFWMYPTALPGAGNSCRVLLFGANDSANAFYVGFLQSGELISGVPKTGYSALSTAANTVELNKWQHVAVIQNGANSKIYKNGVLVGSGTITSPTSGNNGLRIGYDTFTTVNFNYVGYLSNIRIVKGSAVYTSEFTPSTTPLTAITNTSLLTCQSNRFIDNSSNNFTITRNGDVSVQRFSPFAPSAAYSTATIGGSGYFDGTGDYLSSTATAATQVGSSSFTTELYAYTLSLASSQCLYIQQDTTVNNSSNLSYGFFINTDGSVTVALAQGTSRYDISSAAGAITPRQWYHIALVRNGNVFTLYLNGVSAATTTQSITLNSNANNNIGVYANPGLSQYSYTNGYISNFRVVKGTAVYTGNFTPPTAPLTAITNTSLLLNFTNAAIFDNAMMNDLETVGNAQISTSVKKYGTGSLAFDGSGDSIQTQTSYGFVFGTGDFTVEFWLYFSTLGGNVDIVNGSSFSLYLKNGNPYYNVITLYANGADRIFSSAVQNQTWMHVALTRSNSSVRLFINGVQSGNTYTDNTNYSSLTSFTIGSSVFNGYIDDLRITKGVARYTNNFIPPVQAFPNL